MRICGMPHIRSRHSTNAVWCDEPSPCNNIPLAIGSAILHWNRFEVIECLVAFIFYLVKANR